MVYTLKQWVAYGKEKYPDSEYTESEWKAWARTKRADEAAAVAPADPENVPPQSSAEPASAPAPQKEVVPVTSLEKDPLDTDIKGGKYIGQTFGRVAAIDRQYLHSTRSLRR